jgi:hypothetical protein
VALMQTFKLHSTPQGGVDVIHSLCGHSVGHPEDMQELFTLAREHNCPEDPKPPKSNEVRCPFTSDMLCNSGCPDNEHRACVNDDD